MSPTGEGAVSLSLEKVQATRDCVGLRDGWAAGAGPRAQGCPERTELVFWPGLPGGWFLAITGSHFTPPLVC